MLIRITYNAFKYPVWVLNFVYNQLSHQFLIESACLPENTTLQSDVVTECLRQSYFFLFSQAQTSLERFQLLDSPDKRSLWKGFIKASIFFNYSFCSFSSSTTKLLTPKTLTQPYSLWKQDALIRRRYPVSTLLKVEAICSQSL